MATACAMKSSAAKVKTAKGKTWEHPVGSGIRISELASPLRLDPRLCTMHGLCMATKTISVELDAYQLLKRAKQTPSESFSQVVRRVFSDRGAEEDASELVASLFHDFGGQGLMSESASKALRTKQSKPARSPRPRRAV